MFRAVVYHVLRFARYFFWASVLVVMNACVTTTTGGFNVEPSDEESLENYIQLAVAYFDANDMPNARRHLNNALEIDSRNSEAYNILALISQREGDLELVAVEGVVLIQIAGDVVLLTKAPIGVDVAILDPLALNVGTLDDARLLARIVV